MADRLQKLIAQSGVTSRRAAEELILEGRVRVNGRIVRELGAKADLYRDRVEVDGKKLVAQHLVYYLLHKPRGVVTTLEDPEGRDTIADLLRGVPERVFPVGRLDYHTSGALLITNDGELAQALLHPRKQVPKQYIAKVKGQLEVRELDALRNGVVLDDGYRTKKAELYVLREEGGNSWLHITIHEGKNRQIHRMGLAIGRPVMRLSRVGFAGLTTDGLRPGDYRELYANEVEKLQKDYVNITGAAADQPQQVKRPARPKTQGSRAKPSERPSKSNARPALGAKAGATKKPARVAKPSRPAKPSRSAKPERTAKPSRGAARFDKPSRSRKPAKS